MTLLNKEKFADDNQVFDYTQERLGARSRHGVIAICEQCGQRGVKSECKTKTKQWTEWTHQSTKHNSKMGFWYWSVGKLCSKERKPE